MGSDFDEFDDFLEIIKEEKSPSEKELPAWKKTIIGRINTGRVVPIISNRLTDDLVFFNSHQKLVQGYAKSIKYPAIDQKHDLPRITQYEQFGKSEGQTSDNLRVKEEYLAFLKRVLLFMASKNANVPTNITKEVESQAGDLTVSEIASQLGYPALSPESHSPLLYLAALPLPIFLTTSYHNFLEVALKKAGKEPRSAICCWHDGLRNISSIFDEDQDYEPTAEQPLVYHLHGLDDYPDSLVITEDDHLDFLAYISKRIDAIHSRITQALTQSSLVVLGYRLRDWDFRVLFRGVIKPRPQSLWKTSVAVQLQDESIEKEYVKRYLQQVQFEVAWIDVGSFVQDLYEGWSQA